MPAARSRTENWRRSLDRILERNGALEIALPGAHDDAGTGAPTGQDVIWRVRLVSFSDAEIVVERPTAMGVEIPLGEGVELVGVITIGQNRWMFHTRTLGDAPSPSRHVRAMRIAAPDRVERCTRRSFYRISTAGLVLPQVQVRPLLDPTSTGPAEIAVRERLDSIEKGDVAGNVGEPLVMPEVGPALAAKLLNLGGGGVGLLVDQNDAGVLEARRWFWLMLSLTPQIPAPLGVAAKLAHTRIDSEHRVYVGMSFEFDHNPVHRDFVIGVLCRYTSMIQREQIESRMRRAG